MTSGYTQGLGVVCRALATGGARRIALEDPSNPEDAMVAAGAGLEPVSVGVDAGARVGRNGRQYGADPSVLFVAGSSAGANLAATAALTPNDPHFRPGFERADTSVTAAVCLYGYYGHYPDGSPAVASSPAAYMHAGAPPFFLAHGDRDTIVIVDDALAFAAHTRSQQRGAEQAAA